LFFFFFFQAEDGIRDFHVTGVQTCALPISFPCTSWRRASSSRDIATPEGRHWCLGRRASTNSEIPGSCSRDRHARRPPPRAPPRSEERRVGKEGRSRWSPYD